jgi:uncharacterized damage-inducible protein DinB
MIHLIDLYRHQAWADAEHWRAIAASDAARIDKAVRDRLHHIHFVQHAFLWVAKRGGREFRMTTPEDFPALEDLIGYGRAYHDEIVPLVERLSTEALAAQAEIPWFKNPSLVLTIEEALTQAAMHSHYHRGQNATRLREVGGEPPLTDYIVWIWKGRPAPAWAPQNSSTSSLPGRPGR